MRELFAKHDVNESKLLEPAEIETFNNEIYNKFPRFLGPSGCDCGLPHVIYQMKQLQVLKLCYLNVKYIHDDVKDCTALNWLEITHNPMLEKLSPQLGLMPLDSKFHKFS